jgi:WS/DGAT/MGAT family acyltransferase
MSKRIPGRDALWLHMEGPTSAMANQLLLWFEEPLDWEQLREVIHERLVKLFPRFRQRAVPSGWGFRWEDAADFRLEEHVRRTVLPAPGGRAELEALASQGMSTRLDRARPLWEMQLVEGYGQGSALRIRVHHSLADGLTLMRVLLSLVEERPPGQARLPNHGIEQEAVAKRRRGARQGERVRWVATAGRLLVRRPDPPSIIRGPLGVEKQVVWSEPLPLTVWQRMAHGTGATTNDVFMAVVAGALGRYLREHGARAEELRADVAVQLRLPSEPLSQELGNELGILLVELPVRERDPVARLHEMCRRMSARKHSLEAVVYRDAMVRIGWTRPTARLGLRIMADRCSLTVSNMRGPRHPLFLTGRRVAGAVFWMPLVLGVGLGVSFCSQGGMATLGVAADVGLVPHPREFLLALYQEMRELAGVDTLAPFLSVP